MVPKTRIDPANTVIVYHNGRTVWFWLDEFREQGGGDIVNAVNSLLPTKALPQEDQHRPQEAR